MGKWGNFIKVLKIARVVANVAGKHGVKIKDVPIDKIATAVEKTVKEGQKLRPVRSAGSTGE